jgi:hypothetical protein
MPNSRPNNRGERQDAVALGRQPVESPADCLTNALRQVRAPERGRRGVEATLGHEQAHHFADEKRIAFGLSMDGCSKRRCGCTGGQLDIPPDVLLAEAAECHAAGHGFAHQLAEDLKERVLPGDLDVAIGGDDHDVHGAELAGQELEQQQRRHVGGVQVIQDEQQRLVPAGIAQERGDAVEQAKPRLVGLDRRARRNGRLVAADLRHDLADVCGAGAHHRQNVRRR